MYLNDILIFTKTIAKHCCVSHIVLERLHEHKLFLQHDKCNFETTMIKYLRLVISQGEICMDPVKVAGVTKWPVLMSRKEVQSFLGFVNFYCHFIKSFLHHTKPLFELTKKDHKWSWGEDEQQAFDEIKHCVTSSPSRCSADDSKPFHVEADSLNFATGAVLLQQSLDDLKWHPVTFYSKSLNTVKQNYKIMMRKC